MSSWTVLIRIALRNISASFLNIVIGLIILVGTLLVVAGSSLLNSIDEAMSRSIVASVSGHLQAFNGQSKEDLALFSGFGGYPDITPIQDFSAVKGPLLSLDNVKAVVPMGINSSIVSVGNTLDVILEKLRAAVNKRLAGDRSTLLNQQLESLKDHVRQMIAVLQNDYSKLSVIADKSALDAENTKVLERAASAEFWNGFNADPLNHLEFLENKIAPLLPDADMIFLSYIGTDPEAFRKSFDRMEVVDGQMIPEGHRGLLLPKYQYEQQFKLKTARRLDDIQEALQSHKTIAKDPDLQQSVKQNREQTREIVLQLDALGTQTAVSRLQGFLKTQEKDLPKLLNAFFNTDDANFAQRYKFFYDQLAPLLELYRLRPGDFITLKAYTKDGSMRAVNLKIYGTFNFKGLEKSPLAGGLAVMDLMSFRDLYGYVTADKLAEIKNLEKAAGAKFVDRDKAEAELFGGGSLVSQAKAQSINDAAEIGTHRSKAGTGQADQTYTSQELEKGVVLNAAIFLKDPAKLAQTQKAILDLSQKQNLGLKVVTWQKAAGFLGQFVFVSKAVLFAAVAIIFVVAMVIINNAVMMATLQRVREIGTLRAIGAQRGFVLMMVLLETIVLGLVFGGLGMLLGGGLMKWLGVVGIPAGNPWLSFFFSGPRLFPALSGGNLITAFVIILVVTTLSTFYPALLATRVSPLRAMQTED